MRLMLIWPQNEPEVKLLADALIADGHEIVYWVGLQGVESYVPSSAIFHDHYDAWDALPAPALKDVRIPPPSGDYIASFYATESIMLTMMNKHYDAAPVDERKHIYYTMLGYWKYVMETIRPDAILFNLIPHSLYSYIVYDLAERRGLPMFAFEETWVAGRVMSYRDFWKGSDAIRAALADAKARGTSVADLHPDLREYYEGQKDPKRTKTPWYIHEQRSLAAGLGLWHHRLKIAAAAPFKAIPRAAGLVSRLFRPNLQKEYQRVSKKADVTLPYVYFPLSFQPERTTSPQGGIFHDQIFAIETLAAALPAGWEIFVKEHPSQWWLRSKTRYSSARYRGYYERIAAIPNVRLVPVKTDTFALAERARCVATITGTAGWEALVAGKTVLIFGIPWYRDCPGAQPVRSVKDCKEVLIDVAKGRTNDPRDVLAYLKALEVAGTRAHIGYAAGALPVITPEESMRALIATIRAEMASWQSPKQ